MGSERRVDLTRCRITCRNWEGNLNGAGGAENSEFIAKLGLHPREHRHSIERNVQMRYTCLYPMMMMLMMMATMTN